MIWKSRAKVNEKRWRTRILIATAVILIGALPALRFGPRLASHWEQYRLISEARGLLAKDEYRKAALCLRRTLELNTNHLEATRLFGGMAEKLGRPEAITLRERASHLAPNSFEDAEAWGSLAQRIGDQQSTREALRIMERTGPNRAGYHLILARMAQAEGQRGEARGHFLAALQAEPKNDEVQLEAAELDLEATVPAIQQEAQKNLERLRALPRFHLPALRALAAYEGRKGRLELALPLTKELIADPGATFSDRLMHLSALHATDNPHFAAYLNDLEEEAKGKPGPTALLLGWLDVHSLDMLSRDLAEKLPPEMTAKPPVALKLVENCVLLSDWKKLLKLTEHAEWGESEYLRLAYLSRSLAETGEAAEAEAKWKAAVAAVAQQPDHLDELAQLAAAWRWRARQEALLWYIAGISKRPQAALQTLALTYSRAHDTRNLLRALASLLALSPGDFPLKNNWAMTALLMRSDLDRATEAAREVYEARPTDPHAAATYAFALFTNDRTDDALEVMRKLTPEQLAAPSIAAYYGLLLAALRDPEAPKYLDLARNAKLLPEEEQLITKARRNFQEQ